jgi:hypothetical protein
LRTVLTFLRYWLLGYWLSTLITIKYSYNTIKEQKGLVQFLEIIFFEASKPALQPSHPPIHWVPVTVPGGKAATA